MRIVLTGAGGMLGSDVHRAAQSAGFELVARYIVLRSERPEVPELPEWREGVTEFVAAGVRTG